MRIDAIEGLFSAGLGVSLATDDPAMFETDLSDAYRRFIPVPDLERLARVCEAGISASWAAPERKTDLREQFAAWLAATRLSLDPNATRS